MLSPISCYYIEISKAYFTLTAISGFLGLVDHMVSALFNSFVGILNLRATKKTKKLKIGFI